MHLKKKTIQGSMVLLFAVMGAFAAADASAEVGLYDLSVEHLRSPIELDAERPRLSWKLSDDEAQSRAITQQSYRILVASDAALLDQDKGDLWDSGDVQSSQSVLIPYQGPRLRSRQACFWKVRVTDNQGRSSDWSEIAKWEMALLDASQWSGSEWIGIKSKSRDHELASRRNASLDEILQSQTSPLLRKEIMVAKPVRRARAYVSGVGYSEFYINGTKIGDHVLDPGQTNYEKRTLYVVHDVTESLNQGKNALGIWLGNGFYGQDIGFAKKFGYGQPSARAKLFVEYDDGTTDEFGTDTSWMATPSPIVFDNVYWGESYDARLEIPQWSSVGLDASAWQTAVSVTEPCPVDQLRPQLLPPIKEMERLPPVKISKVDEETWLIDFGKNIAGWVEFDVDQDAGDVIRVYPAEILTKDDGRADQRTYGGAPGAPHELFYVCKGGGVESWAPRFTYGGFQYVEISGLKSAPSVDSVRAVFVRSAVEKSGHFSCSDELINKQYRASLLSLEGNFHSLPEDCPHREKCGWLGDAHATADLCLYNYDIFQFYSKYNQDIQDSLSTRFHGGGFNVGERTSPIPAGLGGVPTFIAPGKRTSGVGSIDWGIAYLILPWQMYLHSGDAESFRPHFDNVKDFVTYFRTYKTKQGIISNGLGDWCPPRWDRRNAPEFMECHPHVSGTAFYYQALTIAGQMARVLGDQAYSKQCFEEADDIKSAFERVYLNPIKESDLQHYGSQTATVMAIRLGMVDASEIPSRVDALVHDIEKLHDGHHSCGIHGMRHLYSVLAENGQEALVYDMMTDTTFPSPGYVLSCGLSTWPERCFEWKKVRYSNSFNHPMNGGFAAFMHESLGGIRPHHASPGYKHVHLKPYLTEHLQSASASVQSPYGPIRSEWKHDGGNFSWEIEIPVNATATVSIPAGQGGELLESGEKFEGVSTMVTLNQNQWHQCEIGSGVYRFTVE